MAGGFDGIRDLASAEVYDPRWGSSFLWRFLKVFSGQKVRGQSKNSAI